MIIAKEKYSFNEAFSELEKHIHGGSEKKTLLFVQDLFAKDSDLCLSCLYTSVYTNIGVADRNATLFALRCIDDTKYFFDRGLDIWALALESAIVVIVRATHCRL